MLYSPSHFIDREDERSTPIHFERPRTGVDHWYRMSGKYVSRGKYRRVSAGTPTASSESELNWNEAILGQGAAGSGSQGTGKDTDLNASELYELQRRCFSCCNVVLQQRASVENGKRMLVRTTYMNRLDWKKKKTKSKALRSRIQSIPRHSFPSVISCRCLPRREAASVIHRGT